LFIARVQRGFDLAIGVLHLLLDESQVVIVHLVKGVDQLLAQVAVQIIPLVRQSEVRAHPVRTQAEDIHHRVSVAIADLLQIVEVAVFELVGQLLYTVKGIVAGGLTGFGFGGA
jgi:Putative N-acetylmannosamine-6-phosphate epimerase.